MKAGLQRRIKALEKRVPEPSAVRKSIVPEWLLAAWQQQGLQFDPSDDASVRHAVRTHVSTGANGECRA
jgi:hypothetical protein